MRYAPIILNKQKEIVIIFGKMGHAPITYWSTWFFMLTVIVFQKEKLASARFCTLSENLELCPKIQFSEKIPNSEFEFLS